jgi:hypothetical protein
VNSLNIIECIVLAFRSNSKMPSLHKRLRNGECRDALSATSDHLSPYLVHLHCWSQLTLPLIQKIAACAVKDIENGNVSTSLHDSNYHFVVAVHHFCQFSLKPNLFFIPCKAAQISVPWLGWSLSSKHASGFRTHVVRAANATCLTRVATTQNQE